MASDPVENPQGGERSSEPHISFVQRLQRHFGSGVDPRIDLQQHEEASAPPGKTESPSSSSPTSVQDFVRRLSPTIEVGSRYEVKQEVASGGMGTILRVWDGDLRRNLAMKVMHGRRGKAAGAGDSGEGSGSGTAAVDPERLGRFLEEAQITGQLDHPGVVPVHDLGIDSKRRCYFTMRFVRGAELKDVLDQAREGKEGWTRSKVLSVVLKVCEAMAYAHSKGVVHRDLKPSNVMVGRFGETYVMDWGLARVLGRRDSHDLRLKPRAEDASALSLVRTVRKDETEQNPESPLITMDGDVIGTPSYMAPEQARGKLEEVGPRSDVYSLGAILYYMLTGQAPYVRPGERVSPHTVLTRVLDSAPVPVEKLAPDEPAELVAVCEKAMARDPERRYASMLEVADDIQAFLENRVVRAYERGSLAEFKKWMVRNKGMAAGIAGMVTLSIASALGFAWQQSQEYARLARKESETAQAKDEAVQNLARAKSSEKRAQENLALANEGRAEADKQAGIARRNEESARRSSYAANILAAHYSLELDDLAEARERLSETVEKLRGWEWKHLDLQAHAPLESLGSFKGVEGLAFHPRLDRAIVLTGQGRVVLKDLASLKVVPPEDITVAPEAFMRTLRQLFSSLAMDVNADGTRLATVGDSLGVQVFDLETGQRPPGVPGEGLPGHKANTSAVAFSPNGRFLASGDVEGEVKVRDALNWGVLRHLSGHIGQVTALAWSPGSDRLASSSRDGSLRVWELETGRELQLLRGHRGAVRGVAWDLDGEQLFSCGEDGAVDLWEVASGRLLRSFVGHEGAVYALDYDPDRNRLVTGSADRTVRVWDALTGAAKVLRGHESAVLEVAFDPTGERVLSGDQDGTVYLWDAVGDLSSTELALHRRPVNAVAFDPAGKLLVSASDDGELVLWDAQTCEPLRRLRGHTEMVNSAVFSADGRTILSGSNDKTAVLWDAETGRRLRTYGPFERWIEAALLTPDGSRVIVASGDKKVRILDAGIGAVLHELSGFQFPAEALALSSDGARLASVGRDLQLWDMLGDLGAPLFTRKGKNSTLVFDPDGRHLATGSQGGLVQLWDAASGDLLVTQQNQPRRVLALAYSPDGKRLVSASEDGEIHVRDSQSLDTLLALREPLGAVRALAFSPDGARIASGTEQGAVRIYETGPARERRELRRAASELRERARELVDGLFAERFLLAEVLRELEGDPGMSHELRVAALRLADLRGDDPAPLLARSLEDCLEPAHADEVYDQALRRATAASDMKGASGGDLEALSKLALGAAALRSAHFAEAERYLAGEPALDEARSARAGYGRREQALRLLFLSMAQCHGARQEEAQQSWRAARKSLLDDVELSQRPELLALLAEVEALVRRGEPAGS